MIDPRLQHQLAARTKAKMVTIEAGHVPFFSKPMETTAIIVAAAQSVSTSA